MPVNSAEIRVRVIDQYTAKMTAMRKATDAFRLRLGIAGEAAGGLGDKLGKASTKLANLRTGFAAMMLTRGLKDIATSSLEFEKAMNAVEGRVEATTKQMDVMRQAAMDLGHYTKFSAGQAADAMANLGMRGYDTAQILKLLPVAATLGTAAETELAESTEMLTGVMKIFEMGIDDANRVTNVLALTATNTANSMPDLVDALKKAGPLGHAGGVGFEHMAAMLGVMGDKMLRGSDAGTLLMNSFRNLIDTSRDAEQGLMALGLTKDDVTDASGKLVDMITLLEKFESVGAGVGDIFEVFQIRGAKAVAVMLGQTPEMRQLLKLYDEQGDAAQRLADIMSKGVVRAAFEASSAWKNMRISMGKSMEPITIALMKAVDWFATFVQKHPILQKIVVTFMLLSTVLLQMVTVLGVVLASIAGVAIAMKYLGIVSMATFGSTALLLGIIAIKVVIITAAISTLIALMPKMWEDIREIDRMILLWLEAKGLRTEGAPKASYGQWAPAMSPLSSSAVDPNSVAAPTRIQVETSINGSLNINDRTGGRVSATDGGGDIPINVSGGYYPFGGGSQ